MDYLKYRKRLDYLVGNMLIWLRYKFDYAKEPIFFLTLGFLMGGATCSFFVSSEVKQIQKEYKAYRDLVDSCFLNPRIIIPSHYDIQYGEGNYHEILKEEDIR